MDAPSPIGPEEVAHPETLERPHPNLLGYYTLACLPMLLFPPAAVAVWLVGYFRYRTLRYRFDDEGVSMRWGILFRREILLNYSRIQDIHLTSNFVERWLGLARIQIQTASGSSTPEMTIEGLKEFEALRDFLYRRMRGVRDSGTGSAGRPTASGTSVTAGLRGEDPRWDELTAALRETATELRAVREEIARREAP